MSISHQIRNNTTPGAFRSNQINSFMTPKKPLPQRFPYNAPSTKKNIYIKNCCGHITKTHYHDFVVDLAKEVKKLDFNINLNLDEKTVFSKVLSAVKQSVEYILKAQEKVKDSDWVQLQNAKTDLMIREIDLKTEAEKIAITTKNLEQLELVLNNKNQKIKENENDLNKKLDFWQKENLESEELKGMCLKLEQEIRYLKTVIADKKNESNGSDTVDYVISSEICALKAENSKLMKILASKSFESEFSTPGKKNTLNIQKIHFEQEKLELARLKFNLEQEKSKFMIHLLENEQTRIQDSRIDQFGNVFEGNSHQSSERASNSDFRVKELDYRECILSQNEKELEESIKLIKAQIEKYNEELEQREKILEEKNVKICEKEKNLNQKIIELKLIGNTLQQSKEEVFNINSNIIPALEDYSQALSQLLADLYSTKQEILANLEKLKDLIENFEDHQACIDEEAEISIAEYEEKSKDLEKREEILANKEKSMNDKEQKQNFEEKIEEITKELKEKLDKVKIREQDLDKFKEKVNNEAAENERAAILLKLTHLELENEKTKFYEKIRIKKQKLKNLKEKYEEHLKIVEDKEKQLANS